jgi:hypothetical protein
MMPDNGGYRTLIVKRHDMKVITPTPPTLPDLAEVRAFVQASKADNTQRAYRAAWREFTHFCELRGAVALPASPSAIVDYTGRK